MQGQGQGQGEGRNRAAMAKSGPGPAGLDRGNGLLLALLAVFLAALAGLCMISLNHLRDVAVAAVMAQRHVSASLMLGAVRAADIALLAAMAASGIALLWSGMARDRLQRLLSTCGPGEAWLLVSLISLFTGHAYLNPGLLLGGDIALHISRFHEVASGLAGGVLPHWTNYQYAGEPLLWFTGPLPFVLGGALAAVVGDANLAAKLILFAGHMLSAWAMFALLRRLGFLPLAASLAAAFFAGGFAQLHLFLYCGVLPQIFTEIFLILIFFAADGIMRGTGRLWANQLIFGIAVGLLIINHQPHAPFVAVYLALFGGALLASGIWPWRRLPALTLAGLCGVLIAGIAVLPVLGDGASVMIEPVRGLMSLRWPAAGRLANLLAWSNSRVAWKIVDYWSYLGLGLIIFGGLGAWRAWRAGAGAAQVAECPGPSGRRMAQAATLCFGLGLFLYNPVVRDIMFLMFFASIAAAYGLSVLLREGRLRGILAGVAVLAVLDMALTAIQPINRTDKGFALQAGHWLQANAPGERVAEIAFARDGSQTVDMGPNGSLLSYDAMVGRIAGNHNMAATRLHNFLAVAVRSAGADLQAGRLSPRSRAALGLFNVTRIVCTGPAAMGCPAGFAPNAANAALGAHLRLPASPVLFSARLRHQGQAAGTQYPMVWPNAFWPEQSHVQIMAVASEITRALGVMMPDFDTQQARALEASDAPDSSLAPPPGGLAVALRGYEVGLQQVRARVQANAPCFLQLAHPAFAGNVVRLNGVDVIPMHSPLNLIVLKIPAGISEITITPQLTAAERAGIWASVAGLGALLLLSAAAWARGR